MSDLDTHSDNDNDGDDNDCQRSDDAELPSSSPSCYRLGRQLNIMDRRTCNGLLLQDQRSLSQFRQCGIKDACDISNIVAESKARTQLRWFGHKLVNLHTIWKHSMASHVSR